MDSNNGEIIQSQPIPMDGGDWRSQLQPDSRQRIVNKIMDTLKSHLPSSGEGVHELKQIAIRFEEKIYSASISQSDYLRKISLKMLTMESKSLSSAMHSNSAGRNPHDPVSSQNMQSQVQNQNRSVPHQMVSTQSQARQQFLAQNIQNNTVSGGMQTSASLPNTLLTNGLVRNPMPNVVQISSLQKISGISQNSRGNTMNQGIASDMLSNAQRQLQGGQQQVVSQQHHQQTQSSQPLMYQQQFQRPMLNNMLQKQNIQPPPMQKQQQQSIMQTSSVLPPSTISGLQQNQQLSIQQPTQSVLHQHQQSDIRQQQQQPQQTPIIQQQPVSGREPNCGNMQQNSENIQRTQLIAQQPNVENMQQNQLIVQQINISDMQKQKLPRQQGMLGQQNNIQNMVTQQATNHQTMQQQQHVMDQQGNLQNVHQQLGPQNHVDGQRLVGIQSENVSMQGNQHTKMPVQPQTQNALPGSGGQQQQQLQFQPTQLQQRLGMKLQSNSLQHNMQQCIPNINPSLQPQNFIDQQMLFQSPRATPEAPSKGSLDSTAQTDSVNVGDWQEEVYQKIKSMKDMYYADLNEMYQKISIKLQQHDSLTQQPKIDQIEKLRMIKQVLERLIQGLQITKNNISPSHVGKLPVFERQILNLINPRKNVPSVPQGQTIPLQPHSMGQPHSQIPQAHSPDGGVNPQMQSMNIPRSVSSMSSLQHSSIPTLSAISQQNIPSSLQPSSNLDSRQTGAQSSMQQNTVSVPQLANIQMQNRVSLLQNVNNLHTSTNMFQNQHLKQQEQQIIQSQHLKQPIQNNYMPKQEMPQQQFNQPAKQLQASQMQAHLMSQGHQLNDVNDQMRNPRSGTFAQHPSSAQRSVTKQLKPGDSLHVSSPQLLNAVSPQIYQHSSPLIDQKNLPSSVPKGGAPLHLASSPFVPSPSTMLVPSPMPGENEKPSVSSLTNVANGGHQQTSGVLAAPQSIGTPGISPSPLFECAGPDCTRGNASVTVSGKSSLTEQPIERLLRAVKSISPKALTAAVSDISSVVSMVDCIAGSSPGNSSRAMVGEDLVAMTKCRLQARNFLTQGESSGTKRMRRYISAMPLNVGASVDSISDSLKQLNGPYTSELESTATSDVKKARIEVNFALLEEIREINQRLIDTVVDISDENAGQFMAAPAAEGGEGTIVKCSYNAITLSRSLRSQYTSNQMSQIQPLKLLVPANYPNCSPIMLDKLAVDVSHGNEDLSVKAKKRFSTLLRSLSHPMSLKDIVRIWDDCSRAVICEYAQLHGGGTFSSKYGTWENCLTAA